MKYPVVVMALIALPLPTLAQTNSALITNGRALFNDTRLSGSGQYSCASCHPNGHTNNKTYVGRQIVADGDPAGRNTPTLWGAGDRQAGWSWAGNMPTIQAAIRAMIVDRMKGPEPTQADARRAGCLYAVAALWACALSQRRRRPERQRAARRQARLRAVFRQGRLHELP